MGVRNMVKTTHKMGSELQVGDVYYSHGYRLRITETPYLTTARDTVQMAKHAHYPRGFDTEYVAIYAGGSSVMLDPPADMPRRYTTDVGLQQIASLSYLCEA